MKTDLKGKGLDFLLQAPDFAFLCLVPNQTPNTTNLRIPPMFTSCLKLENTISRENNIRNLLDVVVSSRKFSFIYKINPKTLYIKSRAEPNKKSILALSQFLKMSSVTQKRHIENLSK